VVGPSSHTIGEHRVRDWHRCWLPLLAEAKRRAGYARDSVRIMVQAGSALVAQAVEDELLRHHPVDPAARKHPALARHLENAIRTGTFCRYQPDRPLRWEL